MAATDRYYGDGRVAMEMFLEDHGLLRCSQILVQNEFDMGALRASTKEDLKAIGLKTGSILSLMKALKSVPAPPPPPASRAVSSAQSAK